MAVRDRLAARKQQVGIEIHPPRGGDGRIEGAKASRGRIAGIGETSQPLLLAVGVQPFEPAPIHDGFAAHFKLGAFGGNLQRERADGARVFGDVFSYQAVAAGHRLGEPSVAIVRRHGQPVQLQFGDVIDVSDPVQKIPQLAFVERIVEAEHLGRVRHFDETFARLAADALSRGVRSDQLRMRLFQRGQLAHQLVVLGVSDAGLIEDVVQVLVMAQRFAQVFDFLAYLFGGRHLPLLSGRGSGANARRSSAT